MPPKKKISADPTANVANTKKNPSSSGKKKKDETPPPTAIGAHHPLFEKTVACTCALEGKKKKVTAARLQELGGKLVNFTPKTNFLVKMEDAVDHVVIEAMCYDIPVWTEEEFNAVCSDGWSAVPVHPKPIPAHLECLLKTTKLDENHRKALLCKLCYECETDYHELNFHVRGGMDAPPAGEFLDVVFPIIMKTPQTTVNFCEDEIQDTNVKLIMDAIVARGDEDGLEPMESLAICRNEALTDKGIRIVADALPKTSLNWLQFHMTKMTEDGLRMLLAAVEKTPSMENLCVDITKIKGGRKVLKEWAKGPGEDIECDVS